jgi:hypothetical protein
MLLSDNKSYKRSDPDPDTLMKDRDANNPQLLYNLVTEYPELLQGIVHAGQTFALLCVNRGYADVLTRLINEDYPVDLATPCELYGPTEPQTCVLKQLLFEVKKVRLCKECYTKVYEEIITDLTKLIIKKYPNLLDLSLRKAETPRQEIIGDCISGFYNLYDLRNLFLEEKS